MQNTNSKRHMHLYCILFIAALSTIANMWKQLNYPSINEWIKKCIDIHGKREKGNTYYINKYILYDIQYVDSYM